MNTMNETPAHTYYVTIDGIEGPCKDEGFENTFKIHDFVAGTARAARDETGNVTGKQTINPIYLTIPAPDSAGVNKLYVAQSQQVADIKHIHVVHVAQSGEKLEEDFRYEFETLSFTNVQDSPGHIHFEVEPHKMLSKRVGGGSHTVDMTKQTG